DISEFAQALVERGIDWRRSRLNCRNADTSPCRLLRAPRKRPCRRAAEQHDELPPPHSITSSARASSEAGMSRPSVFAVLRLMTSSNFVGCSTGRSAGLAPLRILSTKNAARRQAVTVLGP